MFVGLWIHQKWIHINSSWFKQTETTRFWSESNLAYRLCWTIEKKLDVNSNATDTGNDQFR